MFKFIIQHKWQLALAILLVSSSFVTKREYVYPSTNAEIPLIPIFDTPTLLLVDQSDFTPENLKKFLKTLNLKHTDVIYKQAVLESGAFTSRIYLANHNLFGMKEAENRPTTALGTRFGHAYYKDWRSSVIDYALFQASYARKKNRTEYLSYLDANYAKVNNYTERLFKK